MSATSTNSSASGPTMVRLSDCEASISSEMMPAPKTLRRRPSKLSAMSCIASCASMFVSVAAPGAADAVSLVCVTTIIVESAVVEPGS